MDKPYIQQLQERIESLEKKLDQPQEGNNNQLIKLLSDRVRDGNTTFGRQMPLDGTYNLEDALEEALDLCLYVACVILETHKATKFNKLVVDKIMEHFNIQSIDGEEQVLTGENFDEVCSKAKKSLDLE